MVRCRAGFYVTPTADYRIVRRKHPVTGRFHWAIDRWSPGELRWERLTDRPTLASARQYVELEIALAVERA